MDYTKTIKALFGTIKNLTFAKEALNIFDACPDYTLTRASASSGKYHPTDEICPEGSIRHMCRVAVFCAEAGRKNSLSLDEIDILTAGALIHDMFIFGV